MSPYISAVVSHVDRNVAHNPHAATIAMISEFFPLAEELKLRKFVDLDLGRQSGSPFGQRCGVSLSNSRVPIHPSHVLVNFLARHEQRVIVQPIAVALAKSLESATVSGGIVVKKRMTGFAEQTLLEVDHAGVFDLLLREIRGVGQVLRGQNTLLTKSFQIDEKRVAGEGGKTLVWRIAVSRRTQWQYLPNLLSGLSQKIDKFVGRISQIANTVATRQGCYVKKDSTAARKDHPINVILPGGSPARGPGLKRIEGSK